jgi:hypothetical protein
MYWLEVCVFLRPSFHVVLVLSEFRSVPYSPIAGWVRNDNMIVSNPNNDCILVRTHSSLSLLSPLCLSTS